MQIVKSRATSLTEQQYTGEAWASLVWTNESRQRLAAIIKATIQHRGMSERGFTEFVNKNSGTNLSPNTVNRLASAKVVKPSADSVKAIAPFVYVPKSIDGDFIEPNLLETFSGPVGYVKLGRMACGVESTKASTPGAIKPQALVDFILDYQDERKLTQRDFEGLMTARTGLTAEAFRRILSGEAPTESDLFWLAEIIRDSEGRSYSWDFWKALKDGMPPR